MESWWFILVLLGFSPMLRVCMFSSFFWVFPPQAKDMCYRMIAISKLFVVYVCVCVSDG